MDYKEKLIKWNSTEKYRREVSFLKNLIPSAGLYWVNILDFGCGLGYTAYQMCADGYDVNIYKQEDVDIEYYINELPNKKYSYIYLMHSISHIPNPSDVLRILRGKYPEATLTVITPNAEWLDKYYTGDETVIKHYTQKELKELFESCGYIVTLLGQFGEYKEGKNERIFLQAICDF